MRNQDTCDRCVSATECLQVTLTLQRGVRLCGIPDSSPGTSQRVARTWRGQRHSVLHRPGPKPQGALEPPSLRIHRHPLPRWKSSVPFSPKYLRIPPRREGRGCWRLSERLHLAFQKTAFPQWTKGSGHLGMGAYAANPPGKRGGIRPREAAPRAAEMKGHTRAAENRSSAPPSLTPWEGDELKSLFGKYQHGLSEPRERSVGCVGCNQLGPE